MRIFVSNLGYSFIGPPNTIIGANIRHDLAFEVYKAISLIMASFVDCLLLKEHLLFSVTRLKKSLAALVLSSAMDAL